MDTIFALATAPGKAGVAVIRISGPDALAVGSLLSGQVPLNGRGLRVLRDGTDVIDEALCLTFSEGQSYTGEAVFEVHSHGSPAVVRRILASLDADPRTRLAEPGEFTRRALENGRMDLTQVEGLSDLIDAETEAQRKQAQRVFSGGLARMIDSWRSDLLRAAGLIEVTIDFADEEIPVDVTPEVIDLIEGLIQDFSTELARSTASERIRDGFEVAIVGIPNAGKSTLLNAMAGRNAAITSDIAGTTRDVIEVHMDLDGLPVTMLDTAGIRDSSDVVERLGVDLARQRAEAADLRIWLRVGNEAAPVTLVDGDLTVAAKADRAQDVLSVSGKTGRGVDELLSLVQLELSLRVPEGALLIRERQRAGLRNARGALQTALEGARSSAPLEIIAEDLRSALRNLDIIVGRIGVEDVLGEIFSRFCLGK